MEEEIQSEKTSPSKKKTRPTVIVVPTQKHVLLSLSQIPESIIAVEDMLGFVPKLKYAYHDFIEVAKFHELA